MREKRKDGETTCRIPTGFSMPGWLRTFFYVKLMALAFAGCTKNEHFVGSQPDPGPQTITGISGVIPKNLTESVVVNPVVSVTFDPNTDPSYIASADLSLKKGNSIVPGTTAISGKTKMFTPTGDLSENTEYTARVSTRETNSTGGVETHEYSWKFKTGKSHRNEGPTVVSVTPPNSATDVPVNSQITVTFDQEVKQASKAQISVTLKNGATSIAGTLSFSGNIATFTPAAALTAGTLYTASVGTGKSNDDDDDDDLLAKQQNFEWSFTTGGASQGGDATAPAVSLVAPANNATGVSTGSALVITFSEPMNAATITSSTVTLKQGTTAVTGTVAYSGTTATFTPSAALAANTVYTGTVTTGVKDAAGNALASNYSWSFTTAAAQTSDVTAPVVNSVVPANNATNVATSSKLTITFSEAMNAATITSTNITLKQGTTAVTGTVAYSGTTATFTPSAALAAGAAFTATVTTGVKDAAGNALASNYNWSFTTAAAQTGDVTAPTVSSVTPASNATNIAADAKLTIVFSEAMNASTITSANITLKQGTTAVTGTVTYSGTTATFTPSAALTGNTVYTATVTTGVKDAAGNALATNYTWTFTTATTVALVSFASSVAPTLNKCNLCHTHPWTVSSNASTFYNNLVSQGYVNTTTPTSSTIYVKLNTGHPGTQSYVTSAEINNILTWFTQGAKNN